MTQWIVRGSGDDNNGGTSPTVLARGIQVSVVGALNNNVFTDPNAHFTQALVGQAVVVSGPSWHTVLSVSSPTVFVCDGASLGNSNKSYVIGGAFATLQNFNGTLSLVAGDSVVIGAGVYRRSTQIGFTVGSCVGTPASPVAFIGDVDGSITGDAGEVVLSGYTADRGAPGAFTLWGFATTAVYNTFTNITFIGGNSTLIGFAGATNLNMTFTDCVFNAIASNNSVINQTVGNALHWLFDRCVFVGRLGCISLTLTQVGAAGNDYDVDMLFRNCFMLTPSSTGISVAGSGANTGGNGGGVRAYHCTIIASTCLNNSGNNTSTRIPIDVKGCVLFGGNGLFGGRAGAITEDYNLFYTGTARQNTGTGPGSVSINQVPAFDLGQAYKWKAPIVTMAEPFMTPAGSASVILGFGTNSATIGASAGASAITTDFLGRPRPAGGLSSAHAVGYMEYHDFANSDSTFNDSPSAAVLVGPGDQYLQIPVDGNASATISIYVRYDSYTSAYASAYGFAQTGGLPSVTLLANGELGITAQTQTCTAAGNGAYQQLTFNAIYPSKPGWVTLQVSSFDTHGPPNTSGKVRFDTVGVV